jgi:hypothetical protein
MRKSSFLYIVYCGRESSGLETDQFISSMGGPGGAEVGGAGMPSAPVKSTFSKSEIICWLTSFIRVVYETSAFANIKKEF